MRGGEGLTIGVGPLGVTIGGGEGVSSVLLLLESGSSGSGLPVRDGGSGMGPSG